jgi:hypothetical protein
MCDGVVLDTATIMQLCNPGDAQSFFGSTVMVSRLLRWFKLACGFGLAVL